jgi:Domain of unknown function (DUF4345)
MWNQLGSLITLGLGLLGLVAPTRAASFVHMHPDGLVGISELRATYGGFFTALGALALLRQDPIVFQVLGLAWCGAALGRALSAVVDGSRSATNLGGILFEGGIGALLLV